jgi:FkbM family methyltransferase
LYINRKIKQFFRSIGVTIDRYPTGVLRQRMNLLAHFNINVVYDVGANTGQYGKLLRRLGYRGRIISFEPLPDAFAKLQQASSQDGSWSAWNIGIGDENGEKYINVSKNSVSSSFQGMLPSHVENSPDSAYVRREKAVVRTMETVFAEHHRPGDITLLKIDTQGFERNVLEGAKKILALVTAIQMEMSLSQTYENEPYFLDMIDFLSRYDFKLFSIEPGHMNKRSGQMYQADGIFFKKHLDQK